MPSMQHDRITRSEMQWRIAVATATDERDELYVLADTLDSPIKERVKEIAEDIYGYRLWIANEQQKKAHPSP